MTKTLLRLRLRSLLAGLTAQAAKNGKNSKGMTVLLCVLLLYVLVAMGGMMAMNFYNLAQPYHQAGLDWLYFSMAGLMALCFSVIGSVFTTQSQLYDAKDNFLLLSMPIPPGKILLSRMLPLLMMNLLFSALVIVPAMVVYGIFVQFRLFWIPLQLLGLLAVVLLSQSISCVFGWLLHRMLCHVNKTVASVIYLAAFLGIYFTLLSNAQNLLSAMISSSAAIADALSAWVWPLYAMGMGSAGSILHSLVLPLISCVVFGIIYFILSVTFIKTATRTQAAGKRRSLNLASSRQAKPVQAILRKELQKFLRTPIYLTNMGFGILMLPALAVAGVIFREDLLMLLTLLPGISDYLPLVICAVIAFMVSTVSISTPSVSLEGKSIWILKALPLTARQILVAKLGFHCRLAIPMPVIVGAVLAAVFGCSVWQILLCALIPGLLALFNGLLGMLSGLKWAQLDYISEAYPCKQSVSVVVSMFGTMGFAFLLGVFCVLLKNSLPLNIIMAAAAALLVAVCIVLCRILLRWGPGKWDRL